MSERSARQPQSRKELVVALQRSFVESVTGPVEQPALTALFDLGLSAAEIASYFAVSRTDVAALCEAYGLRY